MRLPSDVVNRALDELGQGKIIGSFEDGTTESELARRWYGETLRQLLRMSHWSFARKRSKMQLLGDRLNQVPDFPGAGLVEPPWRFSYAWPIDCVRPRWVPWNRQSAPGFPPGNLTIPPPLTQSPVPPFADNISSSHWHEETPARFLSSSTDQFPTEIGVQQWDQIPDLDDIEGVGPNTRRIILTDVFDAWLVYTRLALEIETWDELFSQAMVDVLAIRFAPTVIPDPKERAGIVAQRTALAELAIGKARMASANEVGFLQTASYEASWLRARTAYGYGGWGGGYGSGAGYFALGWEDGAFGYGGQGGGVY